MAAPGSCAVGKSFRLTLFMVDSFLGYTSQLVDQHKGVTDIYPQESSKIIPCMFQSISISASGKKCRTVRARKVMKLASKRAK